MSHDDEEIDSLSTISVYLSLSNFGRQDLPNTLHIKIYIHNIKTKIKLFNNTKVCEMIRRLLRRIN